MTAVESAEVWCFTLALLGCAAFPSLPVQLGNLSEQLTLFEPQSPLEVEHSAV